jgi:hypothetical protein
VAEISLQVVQPCERPCVAMQIRGMSNAADRPSRGTPRLFWCQTATTVLVFEQREMGSHFAREVGLKAIASE